MNTLISHNKEKNLLDESNPFQTSSDSNERKRISPLTHHDTPQVESTATAATLTDIPSTMTTKNEKDNKDAPLRVFQYSMFPKKLESFTN